MEKYPMNFCYFPLALLIVFLSVIISCGFSSRPLPRLSYQCDDFASMCSPTFNTSTQTSTSITASSILSADNVNWIRLAASYSAAAHCIDHFNTYWGCPPCQHHPATVIKQVFFSSDTLTRGYLAIHPDRRLIIVAFRGSDAAWQWMSNLDSRLVVMKELASMKITLKVHAGFYRAFESISESVFAAIQAARKTYPDYEILFTGHSLGGALSSMTLAQFVSQQVALSKKQSLPPTKSHLITFGQPRTGSSAFAKYISSLSSNPSVGMLYRVVNNGDIIPKGPPSFLGYRHHGQEIWFRSDHNSNPNDGGQFIACNDIGNPQSQSELSSKVIFEDPTCSSSLPFYSLKPKDHVHYFGFTFHGDTCV